MTLADRARILSLVILMATAAVGLAGEADATGRPIEVFASAGVGGVLAGERVDGSGPILEAGGVINVWRHHGVGVRLQLQDGLEPDSYASIARDVAHQQRWAVFWRWRLLVGDFQPYAVIEYGYESLRLQGYETATLREFNVSTNNLGLGLGARWRLGELVALQGDAGWWLTPQGGNIGEKRPQQWSVRLGLGVEY
jgi:hypothetical protein